MWCGSYDNNIYQVCMNESPPRLLFSYFVEAPIFATPAIATQIHIVFVATLSGSIFAFANENTTHPLKWRRNFSAPVFSTPVVLQRDPPSLILGCCDKYIWCISCSTGTTFWKTECCAPVFSSPAAIVSCSQFLVAIGSHDGRLRVLDATTGCVILFHDSGSPVFGKPHFFSIQGSLAVTWASTAGEIFCGVIQKDFQVVKLKIAEEGGTFSSPLVIASRILVGCRDNYFNSLDIVNQ